MFILSYAFPGSAQSCSSGLHNSLIAETSFSFISSLFSLIVVNSFSVSREPITKRGELKSDFRPGAFTKRCNTYNAHKRHSDVKKLINASGEKKKLIPCCMHIIFMSFCSHWCLGKPEMHQSRRWSNSSMALRSSSVSSPYSCCTA